MNYKIGDRAIDSAASQAGHVVGLVTQFDLIRSVRLRFPDGTERLVRESAIIPSCIPVPTIRLVAGGAA